MIKFTVSIIKLIFKTNIKLTPNFVIRKFANSANRNSPDTTLKYCSLENTRAIAKIYGKDASMFLQVILFH